MRDLFEKIFGTKNASERNRADYEKAKDTLQSADVKKRLTLAKNTKTNKEILYYLAEQDPEPAVRKAVAENKSVPVQVTPILAQDTDQDVRLALAKRLIDLLPNISEDKQSQLYAFVVQALGTLALDEVLKIRIALSSTLKDHAHTPPKVAGQLARDVEREVSEPILRFCAALSDEDLLDILMQHPASWAVQAIAGRAKLSGPVSEAVIDTEDRPAGVVLISNDGAEITTTVLHKIVEKARSFPEWQKPMAMRKKLPGSVAQEMAQFVDASVRDLLLARGDFDSETTEEITSVFRRRMDFAADEENSIEPADIRVQKLLKEGNLTEDKISDAVAMRDWEFMYAALAEMAGTTPDNAKKIFDMKAPKALVALSWKAGLSMRMALQLQKEAARVPHKELIYPRGGTDYPMTEDELTWQLEFLGIKS